MLRFKKAAVSVTGLDAAAVERELNQIYKTGKLTPEAVVAAAANPESPLHDGFTWDDGEAAEKYRLYEASRIIRALVRVEETERGERTIRAYVNVKDDDEPDVITKGKYVPMARALKDPRYRRHVLETALADAEAYADKYRDLEELSRIVRAIDITVREYEKEHATA